ncbi:hypothetical protein RFI_04718 [Reticulomyxa filosa]|uniref:Uncharacterized protein n=1 Tax=Reticulomyxa filosa TaxID=46433 RepID=X6P1J4_RETFI|nr:hypothetical protein RFI_04718 [Reticulomyxa filosa]|eukprot:ETO32400.1 hypothetical protein RFI_04718 [Reticulomyxa filosa]
MQWWKEKNEKDKEEIISKFGQLSTNDFATWLLYQSKWKHDLNEENIFVIYAAIESYIDYHFVNVLFFSLEKNKKWMKWWNQREQKDKTEIIEKFKTMTNEQFGIWLLSECKWKNGITKDDINSIRFSIDTYFYFVIPDQDKKEDELTAYVIVDGRKKLIKMKELTFKELFCQSCYCLESKDFQKKNKENMKLQLVNMNDNIVESDKDVIKEFESKEPTFTIIWTSFQQLIIIGKQKPLKMHW